MTSTAPMRGWRPLVLHVDQFEAARPTAAMAARTTGWTAGEGHHAPVVGLVAAGVEQAHAVDLANGPRDLLRHLGPPALAQFGTHSISRDTGR